MTDDRPSMPFYQSFDDAVVFSKRIPRGKYGEEVRIHVRGDFIHKLSDMIKVAGHCGHAVYHLHNPGMPFPCSSCTGVKG